jgi:hypothetical protein
MGSDRSEGPLCPHDSEPMSLHEEMRLANKGNHRGLPLPSLDRRTCPNGHRGRVAGWGALILAVLLVGGCSLPGRSANETPEEVANEPQFTIVTVTIAISPTPRITESHYTVADGDTLSGIAEMFGVSWDAIIQANNLQSQDAIYVGQELVIPAPAASPVISETATP